MLIFCFRLLDNLKVFKRLYFSIDDEISFYLYKFGKNVLCSGVYIAKDKYTYSKTIPEEFRPKNDTNITAQYIVNTTNIVTTTIHVLKDGTIKTNDPYKNYMSICNSMWETN